MDVVAESVIAVVEDADRIQELQFAYERQDRRFFQARFEPLSPV